MNIQRRPGFEAGSCRFFFRSPSHDMAALVSKELGAQEVEDMRENYSYGASRVRDGISIGRQLHTKALVTPSEIMELKDLTCYLRLPSGYPITMLTLALQQREAKTAHFKACGVAGSLWF